MWWILFAVVALSAIGYWKVHQRYSYWAKRGVKQKDPGSLIADIFKVFPRRYAFAELIEQWYKDFPESRYSGFYQLFEPTLLLRDPDLIKQITVKDFDHFVDHRTVLPEDAEPVLTKNVFGLRGKKWQEMRATLSPAFTSSKMRFIFSLMIENGVKFIKYFVDKKDEIITIEMKETCSKFASDVIANTAFGVECDTLREPNNEFYLSGKKIIENTGFLGALRAILFLAVPKLFKFFGISILVGNVIEFFTRLVKTNIESREKNHVVRPDMIHLLLEARKDKLKHEDSQPSQDTGFATVEESEIGKNSKNRKTQLTDEDITAQALIFFLAGFEPVSTAMSFMSYELGVNPDIQERLTKEVDETLQGCKGNITYEAFLSMKYMDQVVSEVLRKWPAAIVADRICTKPYTIEPKNSSEKPLHLEKGTALWFPVIGIHRDPQFYPDPERFDPERFSDENKDKIKPYTYLPFGSGPRNCIGSRFALLEVKTLFFFILTSFQIVPVEKTQIPLVLSKKQFNFTSEGGFWFGLKRRIKP